MVTYLKFYAHKMNLDFKKPSLVVVPQPGKSGGPRERLEKIMLNLK